MKVKIVFALIVVALLGTGAFIFLNKSNKNVEEKEDNKVEANTTVEEKTDIVTEEKTGTVSESTNANTSNGEKNTNNTDGYAPEDFVELYSDNTKLVYKNGNAYMEFKYSGDKVTSYSVYAEYDSSAAAKIALAEYNKEPDETVEKAYITGKYLVFEYKESEYADLSVNDIKTAYAYLQEMKK